MSGNIEIAELEEKLFLSEQTGKQIPRSVRQRILGAIANIEYGSVEVVVHEGKVVQIECREKIRVNRHQAGDESDSLKRRHRPDGEAIESEENPTNKTIHRPNDWR
jgi:hypothetical protein